MVKFCCAKFLRYFENPPRGAYGVRAQIIYEDNDADDIELYQENKGVRWWADTTRGEYSGFPLSYCPFCGAKLP